MGDRIVDSAIADETSTMNEQILSAMDEKISAMNKQILSAMDEKLENIMKRMEENQASQNAEIRRSIARIKSELRVATTMPMLYQTSAGTAVNPKISIGGSLAEKSDEFVPRPAFYR